MPTSGAEGNTKNGWRLSYKIAAAIGTFFPVIAGLLWLAVRVQAVAQLPPKVDSLRMAHDTQTAILREQLKLQRCLVIYSKQGCVALARQGDQ
jgi:hypothetical protein